MVSPKTCPGKSQLRELIKGKLAHVEEAEVSSHLEHCEKCQRAVEQLAPAREELLPLCVNGSELQLETREQALKQAMERLHAVEGEEVEAECQPTSDDDLLKTLSPSENAESLGHLGPYEVTAVIGRGGMGAVFKAIDTTLNRVVAVKILSPALASNGTARQRFVREAHSAAAVVHDHVITIHAVDETGGQPYLVMQFVSGISLQEKIDHSGPLDVKEILRIARQIAGGLAAAHEQGLVHRDIKPSNILLENGVERVKITDFGLARAVDDASITDNEMIAGTPQYMAPEQANGETVDHRSDLFSLGSVMYTMCTGGSPFRANTTMGTLRSVSDKRPRSIREVNTDIPEWLVETIDRLHEKEPAKRYQSATEVELLLAEQLAHIQQPAGNSDSRDRSDNIPANVANEQPPESGRSRWRVGLVAGLLIILLGLSVSELTGTTTFMQSLAVVFRIETPKGTVIVEVDDPTATVTLDGEEIVIGAEGFKELRLKPGSYDFYVRRDGATDLTQRVVVTHGSRELVNIRFEERPAENGIQQDRRSAAETEKAQERIKILQQRFELLIEQYRAGNVTVDRVVQASNELRDAELDIANSAEERAKKIEEQLAHLKTLEAMTEALYRFGKCGPEDVLTVQVELMNAEAKLKRENKSPKEEKKAQAQVKILKQRAEVLEERYRVGEVSFDRLTRALIDVLKAELQLATSAVERIKNLQQQVSILKELEGVLMRQHEAGEIAVDEILAARADRIEAESKLKGEQVQTCPMHPQIRKMGPGDCPICGMALLPADRADDSVARLDLVRTVGTVSFDERHVAHIRAPAPARVDRVFVDHVGVEVNKGDAIVELFSAEIYTAEEELIQALKYQKKQPKNQLSINIVAAARRQLQLLGLTEKHIRDFEKRDKPNGRLTLNAPGDGVVTEMNAEEGVFVKIGTNLFAIADPTRLSITLDAREADIARIRRGQQVTLTTDAHPDITFHGRIAFIAPIVDPKSRAVKIRVDDWSPDRKLIPGMFIRGDVHIEQSKRPD